MAGSAFPKLSGKIKWGIDVAKFSAMQTFMPERFDLFNQRLTKSRQLFDGGYAERCQSAYLFGSLDSARNWASRMQRVAPTDPRGWLGATEVDMISGNKASALSNAKMALDKCAKDPILERVLELMP